MQHCNERDTGSRYTERNKGCRDVTGGIRETDTQKGIRDEEM